MPPFLQPVRSLYEKRGALSCASRSCVVFVYVGVGLIPRVFSACFVVFPEVGVAERGEGLSAGEKQLISFARIIVKNPSVIILDEATSSISSDMEKLIQSALEVILKGRTSFIVAHRLSTIRNSDRILFIANKGIAEEGSHDQLMAKKGLYYNLNKNLNKE